MTITAVLVAGCGGAAEEEGAADPAPPAQSAAEPEAEAEASQDTTSEDTEASEDTTSEDTESSTMSEEAESTPSEDAQTTTSAPEEEAAPAPIITITDFTFDVPEGIAPGAEVTVRNDDTVGHTVTSDKEGVFDIPVGPGEEVTFTVPSEPGEYAFHCTPHPNMVATLVLG